MDGSIDHTDERIAELLSLLPQVPSGWVQAAQELPRALAGLDALVTRATEDAVFRARVVAGLEQALVAEGIEPSPAVVEVFRRRLAG